MAWTLFDITKESTWLPRNYNDNGNRRFECERIIRRFRDKASLEAWENSEDLHKQTEEANKYSTPCLQKATGLETWFTLPDSKAIVPPPKWKMAIVAGIGAYCIKLLTSFILKSFLGILAFLFNLFMNIILVMGLTYLAKCPCVE